jgi:hypothetical protein
MSVQWIEWASMVLEKLASYKTGHKPINIQGISMVYTMFIPALSNIHGISMVYTMDIPCIIFNRVPDEQGHL